ncbi:hypothetical protein P1X15_00740 [Runella sp. MFBS21]|uniref:hypothetical protein n=1 Tax=Runella sp. MFBS21 TaxID=3034018 RepID=UPI0023F740AA|nr:hypothetical protein [Runella sp. MFBS21]MDF7816089.1 hypothetical protein [Runella sp. MFBS21]
MHKTLLFLGYSVCAVLSLKGQNVPSATIADTPLALYKAETRLSPHLYNGNRYHIYDSRSKDHQFFETETWQDGSVVYDGQLYEPINMLYDIVKDKVVVRHQERIGLVQLQSERIKSFRVLEHQFVRLEADPQSGISVTGFYDLLYSGKTALIVRRTKQRQEQIESNKVTVSFPEKTFYYLKKDDKYHIIRSKQAVLGLLKEDKRALKRHLRDKKIKYRKTTELALIEIATQYDKLHP